MSGRHYNRGTCQLQPHVTLCPAHCDVHDIPALRSEYFAMWAANMGFPDSEGLSAERDAQSEVVVQLESLLSTQGFLKRVLSSKSSHIRTAAYTLMGHICYR